MLETPIAMLSAHEIASSSERLAVLVMGTNDLAKELQAAHVPGRQPLLQGLGLCLLGARAAGKVILDGVYNDFRDDAGFREEAEHGRTLGMDGKTLIHPSQVAPCNEIFSPTEEEVAWSRKIIAAFEDPVNAHKGVLTLEGRMVERLHLVMARRTVSIADAIEAMRKSEEEWF